MREDKKDIKFREDLYNTNTRDDKVRIEQTKGNLLEDSYRWLVKTQTSNNGAKTPSAGCSRLRVAWEPLHIECFCFSKIVLWRVLYFVVIKPCLIISVIVNIV